MVAAPSIAEGGTRALYRPSTDTILVPDRGRFEQPEEFYCTVFHELVHAVDPGGRA